MQRYRARALLLDVRSTGCLSSKACGDLLDVQGHQGLLNPLGFTGHFSPMSDHNQGNVIFIDTKIPWTSGNFTCESNRISQDSYLYDERIR
jgi:hypothetical protein